MCISTVIGRAPTRSFLAKVKMSAKMAPELELFVVCGWGCLASKKVDSFGHVLPVPVMLADYVLTHWKANVRSGGSPRCPCRPNDTQGACCVQRLERAMKRKPNVNYKNEEGTAH